MNIIATQAICTPMKECAFNTEILDHFMLQLGQGLPNILAPESWITEKNSSLKPIVAWEILTFLMKF